MTFFLTCPAYIYKKWLLINSFQNIINITNHSSHQASHALLFGDGQLPYRTNCSVFQTV